MKTQIAERPPGRLLQIALGVALILGGATGCRTSRDLDVEYGSENFNQEVRAMRAEMMAEASTPEERQEVKTSMKKLEKSMRKTKRDLRRLRRQGL